MLFWMPDPALWDDPGAVPFNKWARQAYNLQADLFPAPEAWLDQYRRHYERIQQEAEDLDRYHQQQAEYEALMADYEAQGEHIAEMLPLYLHKLGLSYKRSVQDRKHEGRFFERIDYCQIADHYFDEHAYYFQVDTSELPAMVKITDFLKEEVWETLSSNLQSHTTIEHKLNDPERPGLWVVVEHRAGRGLIPRMVGYSDMVKALPKSAPPLTFPVGVGPNGRAFYADMDEVITVLVAGSRGAGKSNTINTILCTWLKRAGPDILRLFLTDLKGGLEFHDYSGIPHLGGDVDLKMRLDPDGPVEPVRLGDEIVVDPDQLIPILKYMNQEMERRQNIMRGKARKISAYNRRHKNKLSHWVLVIDELATLMDSSSAKKATPLLGELARKGRAVGLYLVLATQIPDKNVIPRQIAGNMDCRIVGRLADGPSSALSLGDGSWDATRLPKDLPGRIIWRWNDKYICQAPLISELTIKQTVKAVKTGDMSDLADDEFTSIATELFSYALEYLGGYCSQSDLFKHFRGRIAEHKIKKVLKLWEVTRSEQDNTLEPVISLGDDEYYLLPATRNGNNGRVPRQLMDVIDFRQEQANWLDIIKLRKRQTANGTKNGAGVEGTNSKNGLTAVNQLIIEGS